VILAFRRGMGVRGRGFSTQHLTRQNYKFKPPAVQTVERSAEAQPRG
jgi:hypothetical protein